MVNDCTCRIDPKKCKTKYHVHRCTCETDPKKCKAEIYTHKCICETGSRNCEAGTHKCVCITIGSGDCVAFEHKCSCERNIFGCQSTEVHKCICDNYGEIFSQLSDKMSNISLTEVKCKAPTGEHNSCKCMHGLRCFMLQHYCSCKTHYKLLCKINIHGNLGTHHCNCDIGNGKLCLLHFTNETKEEPKEKPKKEQKEDIEYNDALVGFDVTKLKQKE